MSEVAMIRFVTALLIILTLFAACSRSGNPVLPGEESEQQASQLPLLPVDGEPGFDSFPSDGPEIWGAVDIIWDPTNGEVALNARSADLELRHYKVSIFLSPPKCDDCITVEHLDSNPSLGLGKIRIILRNPTVLWGFDVRGMLRIDNGVDLTLLNADGYTTLFPMSQYQFPAPFKTYAPSVIDHGFAPSSSFSETYELKTNPGSDPLSFTLLVTAGHPYPAGDVSWISGFRQSGQLLSGGGTAGVSFEIVDLQNNIGGVRLDAGPLGSGKVWMHPVADRWEATIQNLSAQPGIYELTVQAHSPNLQSAVTSNYYKAVIFSDTGSFRADLLAGVNADRAAYGYSPLSIDPCLNTVAQYHAQNMADNRFFSHYDLYDWSPWDRMAYYGVTYWTAGENIAVGQDTPAEVESAWMNSPGHKANILGSSFKKLGIGIAPCQPGDPYYSGYYWVQVFTD